MGVNSKYNWLRAEQSRAEQNRAEQSRAEQRSRAEEQSRAEQTIEKQEVETSHRRRQQMLPQSGAFLRCLRVVPYTRTGLICGITRTALTCGHPHCRDAANQGSAGVRHHSEAP